MAKNLAHPRHRVLHAARIRAGAARNIGLRVPLLLLLAIAAVPAQDSRPQAGEAPSARPSSVAAGPRERLLGVVRTATGKPWSDARVFLLSRPVADDECIGEPDLLQVQTDAGGRFRADVLSGRTYTVWARSEPDENGHFRITHVAEAVLTGPPVVLEEEERTPRRTVRLTLKGAERWHHRGPLRFLLVSQTRNVHVVELQPDKGGKIEAMPLPPMPGTKQMLEVYDNKGIPIFVQEFSCAQRTERRPHFAIVPHPVKALFSSHAGSKPVPHARILARVRHKLVEIGKTGTDGYAEIEVANPASDIPNFANRFVMLAPGHDLGLCLYRKGNESHWGLVLGRAKRKPDWFATTADASAVRGRIIALAGVLADVEILVQRQASHHFQNGVTSTAVRLRIRPDRDGRFWIPGVFQFRKGDTSTEIRLILLRPGRIGPAFTGIRPVVPGIVLGPGRPENVVLRSLRPVELRIQDRDGAPEAGAEVRILVSSRMSLYAEDWLVSDGAGRVRVLLPPNTPLTYMVRGRRPSELLKGLSGRAKIGRGAVLAAGGKVPAVEDVATGVLKLDPPGDTDQAAPTPLVLRLRRPWVIMGTVEDGAGNPCTGWVRVLVGHKWAVAVEAGDVRWRKQVGGILGHPIREPNMLRLVLLEFSPPSHLRQDSATDKQGKFRFQVPAVAATWRMVASPKRSSYNTGGNLKLVELKDGSVDGVELMIQ